MNGEVRKGRTFKYFQV